MPLPSPNLDDRTFQQLLDECVIRIKKTCPQWNDLGPSDPGVVLLELFAYLTETMIFRLNRVPEKAYVEFLRLLGVKLLPPAAASTSLRFSVPAPRPTPVEIPRGTRVTIERVPGGRAPPIFTTLHHASIPAGETTVSVPACHAEWIVAEAAGKATGLPGLTVTAQRAPVIAPLGDGTDLVVGVEALPGEIDERAPALQLGDKTFRLWREVESFADTGADRHRYLADRTQGTITFAPSLYGRDDEGHQERQPQALAEVPPAGREIRLWYLCGGGLDGDVGPGMLTVLRDQISGVSVTNPEAATGGSAVESVANALVRGPLELHTQQRAVTARDFEAIALHYSGAVARAKAFTKASLWKHASPGTVELLLVPSFPRLEANAWKASATDLAERATQEVRTRLLSIIDERSPLGTVCLVSWVRYKTVRVQASIVCHREQKPDEVRARVLARLHQSINPLPAANASGWRFGQSLRAFHVYDIILSEPGVKYVDKVRLHVDEVPGQDVRALAADASQPQVWYAAAGEALFRSVDDAEGWEVSGRFPGEKARVIRTHPGLPGRVALATQLSGDKPGARIWLSEDCGESWRLAAQMGQAVDDLAWIVRAGAPALLMATEGGLFELGVGAGAVPVQIVVDPQKQDRGFFAVAVATDFRGKCSVAVAARINEGVWLSDDNGLPHTFKPIGLKGEDVRILEAQEDGPRRFLWAGLRTPGFEEGRGCFRWDLTNPDEGWVAYGGGWTGGSCLGLTFCGPNVVAATHHAGVLRLDATKEAGKVAWAAAGVNCGLPLKEVDRFLAVDAVAVDSTGSRLLTGGATGIFGSADGGTTYKNASSTEFVDRVSLPETWLFCSGEHDIVTLGENEAVGN